MKRVKDVVIALGGLTVKADMGKARVERPLPGGIIKIIPIDLRRLLYQNDESQNICLLPGDSRWLVPAMPTNIYILGEIRSPGAYQIQCGQQIKGIRRPLRAARLQEHVEDHQDNSYCRR